MLQTSPSGPSLGALSLEAPSKGGVEPTRGSNEGFSQEYDKQVKNIDSGEPPTEPAEAGVDSAAREEAGGQPEVKGEGETASADEATVTAEQAASNEEQGGNTLPLEQMRMMAAEVQVQAESEQQAETSQVELVLPQHDTEAVIEADNQESEPVVASVTAPPPQEALKAATAQTAAAVKELASQKVEGDGKAVASADEVATEELSPEEGELPELPLKPRSKNSDLATQFSRHAKQGGSGESMPRGDRGFEALLAAQGKSHSAAASIDTLTPTLAPLSGQGASNPLATPAPVAMTLATPMHQANWGQAMAERVVWMSNANIQEAEIQLNPRELGPVGIKVSVQNDQTNVSFVAQHASTREALEAAIPRLREMLNESGLQLGQSDVSQHSFKGRDGETGEGHGRSTGIADEAQVAEEPLLADESIHGVGYATPAGVDAFA